MKTVVIRKKSLNRQLLADPHNNMAFYERLVKGKAIDLRGNHVIEELDNGYWIIKPKKNDKIYK